MSRRNFAKKFVAYSMAFAVAFSTITVSPVFVKEAKAAANEVTVTPGTTPWTNAVAEGAVWLADLTCDDSSDGTTVPQADFETKSKLTNISTTRITTGGAIPNTDGHGYTVANALGGDLTVEPKGVVINGKNELKLDGATEAGSNCSWFKLIPGKETKFVNTEPKNGETPAKDVEVKFNYFTLEMVANNTADYNMGVAETSEKGLYIQAQKDASSGFSKITKMYNVYEVSNLETLVKKEETFVKEGQAAKLNVSASSVKDIKYTWTKDTKKIDCTGDTLNIAKVTNNDFGTYKVVISDGIGTATEYVKLTKLTKSSYTGENDAKGDNLRAKEISTEASILNADNKKVNGTFELKTTIPAGKYVYVWTKANGTTLADIADADKVSYDATKGTVKITNSEAITDGTMIKCFALPAEIYTKKDNAYKDVQAALAAVQKETDVFKKAKAVDTLRAEELDLVATKKVYTETITLRDNTKLNKSFNVYPKLGESLTLTAPTVKGVKEYKWQVNSEKIGETENNKYRSTDDKLTIETVDFQDYGKITCTVKYCGAETQCADVTAETCVPGHDKTATFVYNVLYNNDLDVKATEVVSAKVGAENVEFVANATSSLPVTYTWTKSVGTLTGWKETTTVTSNQPTTVNKITLGKVAEGDVATFDATTGEPDKYYQCVVSDGVSEDVTLKFAISQDGGFTVGNDVKIAAVDGKTYTLEPTVTVKEGTTVTYKWTKGTSKDVISTEATLDVKFDKTQENKYTCEITDGTYTKTVKFELQERAAAVGDAVLECKESVVYNGKAQDPVVLTYTAGGFVYTLVKDVDYKVEYVENVNVGIARYKVTLIGDFAAKKIVDATANEVDGRGVFYIDRAENEVKATDVTTYIGGNVKPVVTDLDDAAKTIKFYTDKELTKEIAEADVKAKAGTYYAQATTKATTNYNEGKSNVATIVVKALGTTSKLSVTKRTSTTMTVSFAKVTGATSYKIYVKNSKTKNAWKAVANTKALTYKATGLPAGVKTTIAVRAQANGKLAPKYAQVTKMTAPGTTSKVTATTTKNSVKLTWKKVTGATHYRVYMKKSGKWVKVADTKSLTLTKKSLKRKTTYTFAVKAYNSTEKLWADKYVAKNAKTK